MSISSTKPLKIVLKDLKDPHSASSLRNLKPVIVTPTSARSGPSLRGLPDISSPMSPAKMSTSSSPKKKVYRIEGRKSEVFLDQGFMKNTGPSQSDPDFKRNELKYAATTIFENKNKIPFNIFNDTTLTKHKMMPSTSRIGTLESVDNIHSIRTEIRSLTQRERDQSQDSPQYRNFTTYLDNSFSPKKSSTIVLQAKFSLPPIEGEKEDSYDRNHRIRKLVDELEQEKNVFRDYLNYKQNQKLLADETERVIGIAEEILPVMNLTVRSKMDVIHDSVMVIHPVEDRNHLAEFYKKFIPILCNMPFGFLSKIRISVITVCQQVDLFNSNNMGILEQKLLNGLFVIKRLVTRESMRDHWYRIVLYHFIKKKNGFYDEWKNLWVEIQRRNRDIVSSSATKGTRHKPTAFSDLVVAFRRIMTQKSLSRIQSQEDYPMMNELVEFLRDNLIEFDKGSFGEEDEEDN